MGKKDKKKKKSKKGLIIFILVLLAAIPVTRIAISMTTKVPKDVGSGELAPLPKSPNAVSSVTDKKDRKVKPIPFDTYAAEAKKRLMRVIDKMHGTTLVTEKDNYLHYEFKTKVFGFVDDVEFLIEDNFIQMRSASRLGRSDFGVNKKRCEEIRIKFIEDEAEKKHE